MSEQQPPLQWPGDDAGEAPAWAVPGSPPGPPPSSPGPGAYAAASSPGPGPTATIPTYRSWQPGIIPLRPLSFGDFLAVPFKAMRYNRAVVLGGPLLFTLIATLLSVAAMWLLFTDPALDSLFGIGVAPTSFSTTAIVVGLAAILSSFLADVLSTAIVAPGIGRAVLGERLPFGQAWKALVPRLGHVLMLYLLTGLAMFVAGIFFWAPFMIGIATDNGTLIGLSLLLGLFISLPLMLPLSVIAGIARPMVVLERVSAPGAIRRSLSLVKGRFWWSVLIVLVASIIIYAVSSALQFVGQFGAFLGFAVAPDNIGVALAIFALSYGIAICVSYVVMYAFMGSVFTLIYIDLRMRREGFDLDLARAAEARAQA